jgi:hypothetical protein
MRPDDEERSASGPLRCSGSPHPNIRGAVATVPTASCFNVNRFSVYPAATFSRAPPTYVSAHSRLESVQLYSGGNHLDAGFDQHSSPTWVGNLETGFVSARRLPFHRVPLAIPSA